MMRKLLIVLIIGMIFSISCKINKKCDTNNVVLSHSFKAEINSNKYCTLIESSIKKDSLAFDELLHFQVKEGHIIEHCVHVCEVIKILGKKRICNWIQSSVVDIEVLNKLLRFGVYHSFDKQEIQFYLNESYEFDCG